MCENNASCLEWLHVLTLIHSGGISKVTIQPRLKTGTIFRYKSLSYGYNVQTSLRCFSHEMLRHEMVSDNVVPSDLLSQEKSPSQPQLIKIASRRFLSTIN